MNDIELIGSGNKFDWNFTDTDIVDVNGDARLVSAIRHTILLQRRELEQEMYATKGNRLHEIIKSEDINSANTIAKETLEESLREIPGIQGVTITTNITKDGTIEINGARIIKNNGEEIEIGL